MFSKFWSLSTLGAIALGGLTLMPIGVAEAALFDQEEVDQERYIAIAAPLPSGGRYNLIVIEQKSNTRQCWQETAELGVIEPLLLNFDFSGICGRSTDSNGYSIRQEGQDLALKYRLSIQKRDGVLVLMGVPESRGLGKSIEIGRTETLKDDYLKFNLNPDWKFTRRSYQGKVLGHIYFTRDVIPPDPIVAEEPEEVLNDSSLENATVPESTTLTDTDDIETPIKSVEKTEDDPALTLEETVESDPFPPLENQEGLPAWPSSSQTATDQVPNSSGINTFKTPSSSSGVNSSTGGNIAPLQGPVRIPVPQPPTTQSNFGRVNTLRPVPSLPPIARAPISGTSIGSSNAAPLPVPGIAPLGKVSPSEPDVFSSRDLARLPQGNSLEAGSPPPPSFIAAQSIRRYRVFVNPNANSDTIQAIAPDAFVTRHQGQRVLQLGAFLEKSKADLMVQALGQQGINAIIDAAQY